MEDREKRMKREYQSMEDIRRKQEANNKKFRLIKKLAENQRVLFLNYKLEEERNTATRKSKILKNLQNFLIL